MGKGSDRGGEQSKVSERRGRKEGGVKEEGNGKERVEMVQ